MEDLFKLFRVFIVSKSGKKTDIVYIFFSISYLKIGFRNLLERSLKLFASNFFPPISVMIETFEIVYGCLAIINFVLNSDLDS